MLDFFFFLSMISNFYLSVNIEIKKLKFKKNYQSPLFCSLEKTIF